MGLQGQLEEERGAHTATREALHALQREQQRLAGEVSHAQRVQQALEEEREVHVRTQVRCGQHCPALCPAAAGHWCLPYRLVSAALFSKACLSGAEGFSARAAYGACRSSCRRCSASTRACWRRSSRRSTCSRHCSRSARAWPSRRARHRCSGAVARAI